MFPVTIRICDSEFNDILETFESFTSAVSYWYGYMKGKYPNRDVYLSIEERD